MCNCPDCNEHFKRKTDNCKTCNKAAQPTKKIPKKGLYIGLNKDYRNEMVIKNEQDNRS